MCERDFKGVWIPKDIWLNKQLPFVEKVFLVEIDSLDNDEQGCFASNAYFAEFFQISKGRCSQIIRNLEAKGYITIILERKGKEVVKRLIRVVNKLNKVVNKLNTPSKYSKHPYLENDKDNNTYTNNTDINNTINIYEEIVNYLNEKCDKEFEPDSDNTIKLINGRLSEKKTLKDFKYVIDVKASKWRNDPKMSDYLRPKTLFAKTNFESYLNEKPTKPNKPKETEKVGNYL